MFPSLVNCCTIDWFVQVSDTPGHLFEKPCLSVWRRATTLSELALLLKASRKLLRQRMMVMVTEQRKNTLCKEREATDTEVTVIPIRAVSVHGQGRNRKMKRQRPKDGPAIKSTGFSSR